MHGISSWKEASRDFWSMTNIYTCSQALVHHIVSRSHQDATWPETSEFLHADILLHDMRPGKDVSSHNSRLEVLLLLLPRREASLRTGTGCLLSKAMRSSKR